MFSATIQYNMADFNILRTAYILQYIADASDNLNDKLTKHSISII